jgi:hypothetical protein
MRTLWLPALACSLAAACSAPALTVDASPGSFDAPFLLPPAQALSTEVGAHGGAWLGDGEPANDIPIPLSLFARHRLGGDWWARLGVEIASGDFETPHEIVGIMQDPNVSDIDATADYVSVMAWIEQVHALNPKNELFWQAGLGVSVVDVDDADGPVQGGGTFDIETDADTEFLGSLGAGYRRLFGEWAVELLARYDYHVADWELRDKVSGATGEVDDYSTWALLLGLGYSF